MPILTILFCSGIIIAKYIYIPIFPLLFIAVILLAFSLIFLSRTYSVIFLYLLSAILGGAVFINYRILSPDHIAKVTPYNAQYTRLKGAVCDYPQQKNDYTTFTVEARELILKDKLYKVKGKVLVKIFRKENMQYGQQISLTGNLSKPYAYGKNKRYRDYLKTQGVYSILRVKKGARMEHLGKSQGNLFKALAYKIRNKANTLIFAHMPFTQAAIFSAMILGDRTNILPYLNKMFIQTGTVHMLAISGFNVGITALVLEILLKALRVKRKVRYGIISAALIFYCVLTGANPPVVRSTIMAVILLFAYFFKRELTIGHALSVAALIMLIVNPYQLFDVGFQLSFASIISLAYISPLILRLFPEKSLKNRLASIFTGLLCASVGVWLGLSPFIIYYFKIISSVTILANIVVVPYVSLVVILGIAFLFVALFLPCLAYIFALPASLSVFILILIVRIFNAIPFGYIYLAR